MSLRARVKSPDSKEPGPMTPIVGSIVALVTPMHEDGSVDYDTLRALIDWHIAEGTNCIGVVGTTGESPTVTVEEQAEIIRAAVEHAKGRVPIMAGAGANSTAEAIELSRYAKQVGADCTLQVVPYYNKPTQEGQYQHFRTIAEKVDIPMVLYNVPGRTSADLQHDTVLRLAQVPGIVGIKEATGNIERAAWLIKQAPKGFSIYSGDDATAVALMLLGGHGNVSVTANVAPRAMSELCRAALAGDAKRAAELHLQLLPLHKLLFVEPNPIPVKWALARMGRIGGALRLPLVPLSAPHHAALEQALREANLI
ncbi:4-hydroxy-tetrahydrodipicolinate synthase [Caldimonas thermodepolymerans]